MRATILALLAFVIPAFAAEPETGTIFGTIVYPEGGPAKAANIMVDRTSLATQADEQGRFRLAGVPTGGQTLRIFASGHEAAKKIVLVAAGDNALGEIRTGPAKALESVLVQGGTPQDTLQAGDLRVEILVRDTQQKVFDPTQFSIRIYNLTKRPLLLLRARANPEEGPHVEFAVSAPFDAWRMMPEKPKAEEDDAFVVVKPGDWFDPYAGAPLTGVPSRPGTYTAMFKYSTRQVGLSSAGANQDSLRARLEQVPVVEVSGKHSFKVDY